MLRAEPGTDGCESYVTCAAEIGPGWVWGFRIEDFRPIYGRSRTLCGAVPPPVEFFGEAENGLTKVRKLSG